jgi:hypothetical protein
VESEKLELVERMARTAVSGALHGCRELLLYIIHEALEGRPEELSELRIGIRVFGRPESYNPSEDNIVRVAARQLRSKLKEYFEGEGRDESLVLDKGRLRACFPRTEQAAAVGRDRPNGRQVVAVGRHTRWRRRRAAAGAVAASEGEAGRRSSQSLVGNVQFRQRTASIRAYRLLFGGYAAASGCASCSGPVRFWRIFPGSGKNAGRGSGNRIWQNMLARRI